MPEKFFVSDHTLRQLFHKADEVCETWNENANPVRAMTMMTIALRNLIPEAERDTVNVDIFEDEVLEVQLEIAKATKRSVEQIIGVELDRRIIETLISRLTMACGDLQINRRNIALRQIQQFRNNIATLLEIPILHEDE